VDRPARLGACAMKGRFCDTEGGATPPLAPCFRACRMVAHADLVWSRMHPPNQTILLFN